jgi:hypothetical protein
MAATPFQSDILKLLAQNRRTLGECYVAGGVARQLSDALARNRLFFHPGRICGSWPQLRQPRGAHPP